MNDLLERLDKLVADGWDDTGAPYCLGHEHHQAFYESAQAIRILTTERGVLEQFIHECLTDLQAAIPEDQPPNSKLLSVIDRMASWDRKSAVSGRRDHG